ncbi:bifunctional adenosylcobinamide kinase/adenosylcobinamide-phosphate guanylyltransferase [Nonomuraea sp. C10]|uniref:bifunctional adenosylcobinamide kinase/adenosylcobinamide-phosphate guanylyltransferase n=1 Tax=Nonomuraea sp. C10 TaxID=2600577 RepID=UPI0011CDEDB5|nr:bifunctional adenosylcobinamide kinase/adenosylcobinamide-phosphate guanylyltransferase [Nonomuraea sp. C10]TXK42030.1 bifunctional adenosylcobinamide kinase/adenosylcobinamide-phosphate guanylyltransferase [Nonomuraea sp. C10]
MRLLLTGTAGTGGWPEPGCPCASCATADRPGRRPFGLVVDDVVAFPWAAAPRGYEVLAGGLGLAGPDGRRVLCVPADREAPLDAAVPYDVVLIDLLDRPERLGALRRSGAVTGETQVVAVGLDHRVRSAAELRRRLRLWGAVTVPDGAVLHAGGPPPEATALTTGRPPDGTARHPGQPGGVEGEAVPPARRALILGGSRSGKSAEAELRLAAEPYVTYVATGPSAEGDAEWAARVRAHRARRPAHWDTEETTDLAGAIRAATAPLLVDGLGTWLAAVFDEHGAWDGDRTPVDERCDELVSAWRRAPGRVVAVSDEAGMGVVPATASGRAFRDALGRLNERLAAESEDVTLVVAGRPLPL